MIARNVFNTIHTLVGLDGIQASSPTDMGSLAANHFQSILGLNFSLTLQENLPVISSITRVTCSSDDSCRLSRRNSRGH